MSEVDFKLIESMFSEARDQARLTRKRVDGLETQISALRSDIQEGFANLRAHDYSHHGDMAMMERRVDQLETDVERLNHAEGINSDE